MFGDHMPEADIIRSKICTGNVTDLVLLDGNKVQFKCCWLKGPKTGLEPDDLGLEPETTTDSDDSKSGRIITICVSIFVLFFVVIIIVIICYCFFGNFLNCFFKNF
jgi:hypothetical protein